MRLGRLATTALLMTGLACSDVTSPEDSTPNPVASGPAFALTGGDGSSASIKSRQFSDMCVDVPASAYKNNTLLETWSCHTGANQKFTWKSSGEIVPSSSQALCVDAYGGSGRDGDPIGLWSCHGGVNQRWSATTAGEIKGINGKCIGLVSATRANGTKLTLQTCNGASSQKWDNAGGTTDPAPAPPPSSPLPPGIPIAPGQSIQAAVNANPGGTTFILKAGTHVRQSVIPKSGDVFVGEPGAVLDGQGAAPYAFSKGPAPYPSNVTIRGLKITNYAPPTQTAAVDAGGYYPTEGTTGWVIDNNEVSYNAEYGIRIGNSTQIINNKVHHNKRLNVAGTGNGTLIASNEIAYGNYLNAFNTNFEAGGTKFAHTDGLTLRNNYVHHNVGVGIHVDEQNINTIIETNRIDANGSEGIAIEISYKTIIRNNTVTNNGWSDPRNRYSYLWNAGIGIHASPNVEVHNNTVSGNYAGIVAIEQDRSIDAAKYGPHIVQNLYVHDNIVTQSTLPRSSGELSVGAGIATDIAGNTAVFTSRNNRFVNNRYTLGSNPRPFAWMNGTRTESEWKAYGQDVTGTFTR
jgi:parallel beta-helix repeat protein